MAQHTLSVLVEDKPGVLARISALFSRRGFNITSLAVGPTEHPEISRMTIVVNVESSPLEQVTKQLDKLVHVVEITELDPRTSVERELLLCTVAADASVRGQVVDLVQIFDAKILSVGIDCLIVSLEGNPQKLDDFEDLLRAYGIVELQRTGRVALPKLEREASGLRAVKERAS